MRQFLRYSPIVIVGLLAACGADTPVVPESSTSITTTQANAEVEWFVDRAEATGLNFIHFNGMTGGFYTPEMMGPGVGLFDYDNDGDQDVFIVRKWSENWLMRNETITGTNENLNYNPNLMIQKQALMLIFLCKYLQH